MSTKSDKTLFSSVVLFILAHPSYNIWLAGVCPGLFFCEFSFGLSDRTVYTAPNKYIQIKGYVTNGYTYYINMPHKIILMFAYILTW